MPGFPKCTISLSKLNTLLIKGPRPQSPFTYPDDLSVCQVEDALLIANVLAWWIFIGLPRISIDPRLEKAGLTLQASEANNIDPAIFQRDKISS